MKVSFERIFEKDAKKLPTEIQQKLKNLISTVQGADSLSKINASKMEAAKNAYRIRIGDYRVGFYLIEDEIVFSRVLNRKEMYRYFPRK